MAGRLEGLAGQAGAGKGPRHSARAALLSELVLPAQRNLLNGHGLRHFSELVPESFSHVKR